MQQNMTNNAWPQHGTNKFDGRRRRRRRRRRRNTKYVIRYTKYSKLYIYIHIYLFIFVIIYIHLYIFMFINIYIYIYIYYTYIFVYLYVFIKLYTYIFIYLLFYFFPAECTQSSVRPSSQLQGAPRRDRRCLIYSEPAQSADSESSHQLLVFILPQLLLAVGAQVFIQTFGYENGTKIRM